jgi:predicted DNA-binding transcriptional regulator AlpA
MLTIPRPRERFGEEEPGQVATKPSQPRLLRFPDVRARTGLSRSTVWRLERQGAFPRHRRISANVVAWLEAEVSEWIRSRVADSDEGWPRVAQNRTTSRAAHRK